MREVEDGEAERRGTATALAAALAAAVTGGRAPHQRRGLLQRGAEVLLHVEARAQGPRTGTGGRRGGSCCGGVSSRSGSSGSGRSAAAGLLLPFPLVVLFLPARQPRHDGGPHRLGDGG